MDASQKRGKLLGIAVMLILSGLLLYEGFTLLLSERQTEKAKGITP